jgi:hypothetical protein
VDFTNEIIEDFASGRFFNWLKGSHWMDSYKFKRTKGVYKCLKNTFHSLKSIIIYLMAPFWLIEKSPVSGISD